MLHSYIYDLLFHFSSWAQFDIKMQQLMGAGTKTWGRERRYIICYFSKSTIMTPLEAMVMLSDSTFEHWEWPEAHWIPITQLNFVKDTLLS